MRILLAALAIAVALFGQAKYPPYDPNDPEGLVPFPNGTGRYAWKRKGIWKTGPLRSYGFKLKTAPLTAAELKSITETFNVLTDVQKATPEGSSLIGYFMEESRGYTYPDQFVLPGNKTLASMPFEFANGYFPFHLWDLLDHGKYVPQFNGETESIYYHFNRLPGKGKNAVIAKEPIPDRLGVEFYVRPKVIGKIAGFPVYESGDLVMARAGRDPWAPAPYGRVLKSSMTELEKDRIGAEQHLANLKKQNEETQAPAYEEKMRAQFEKNYGNLKATRPDRYQTRLTSLENELKYNRALAAKKANPQSDNDGAWYWNPVNAHAEAARLLVSATAADGNKPACFLPSAVKDGRYAIQGSILTVEAGGPECQPLVMDNFDYFDPKLSRVTPQILTVVSVGRCGSFVNGQFTQGQKHTRISPPQGCFRHVPIWQTMDWNRVAALLPR